VIQQNFEICSANGKGCKGIIRGIHFYVNKLSRVFLAR